MCGKTRCRRVKFSTLVLGVNRKAVAPSSPGLPLRLPWGGDGLRPYRNAIAPFFDETKKSRNRLAVG